MTKELTIRNKEHALAIDGVEFQNNRLKISRELTREEFRDVLAFVAKAESASLFWTGDILNYVHYKLGEESAKEAAKNFSDPSLALEAMQISAENTERFKLTWQHYRAARQECGNDTDAVTWLRLAEEQKWSVAVMRAAIRQNSTKAGQNLDTKQTARKSLTGETIRFVRKVKEYVANRPLVNWSGKELQAFVEDTDALAEVIREAKLLL
jgi:hypothetical protein